MNASPGNEFNWRVDNFGSTITDAGLGLNSPGHANANTKGANTSMLVGIAEDCFGISIGFSGGNTSATIRRQMVDLLIDPAAGVGNAGTSWSVIIANLYANSPAFATGATGYWYYFPLYLKAGTAIGSAHQDLAASTTALRVMIRCFGKPSRPEQVKYGTKVQTIGATVATTTGVAITPGLAVMGSYTATLGTLSSDAWWWQVGLASSDSSLVGTSYLIDVAANATNKIICAQNIEYGTVGTTEQAWKSAIGSRPPIQNIPSGDDVYVRAATDRSPDDTMTVIVYALGH